MNAIHRTFRRRYWLALLSLDKVVSEHPDVVERLAREFDRWRQRHCQLNESGPE